MPLTWAFSSSSSQCSNPATSIRDAGPFPQVTAPRIRLPAAIRHEFDRPRHDSDIGQGSPSIERGRLFLIR
jgi:hypothetical protein